MCTCYINLSVTSLTSISSATTFSFPVNFIILCRAFEVPKLGILNLQLPIHKWIQMMEPLTEPVPSYLYPTDKLICMMIIMTMKSIIFEKSWQSGVVPSSWKNGDITTYFWKRKVQRTEEVQASQSHLCVWQDHGADPHGACARVHRIQKSHWCLPAWLL